MSNAAAGASGSICKPENSKVGSTARSPAIIEFFVFFACKDSQRRDMLEMVEE